LRVADLTSNETVRIALCQAWLDGNPGPTGAHEEGGFILCDLSGTIHISRWPAGTTGEIVVPPHPECRFDGYEIIASFHTHPNTGREYRQEPSAMDRWTVRDDVNLKGPDYLGELVISEHSVYLVDCQGVVSIVATHVDFFKS
jgi:hypothetical protein